MLNPFENAACISQLKSKKFCKQHVHEGIFPERYLIVSLTEIVVFMKRSGYDQNKLTSVKREIPYLYEL